MTALKVKKITSMRKRKTSIKNTRFVRSFSLFAFSCTHFLFFLVHEPIILRKMGGKNEGEFKKNILTTPIVQYEKPLHCANKTG